MPRNELHDEKLPIAINEMVAYSRQSRMAQPGKQASLSLKCHAKMFAGDDALFQGHSAAEALIPGFVDCAHAPLPYPAQNEIAILQNGIDFGHMDSGLLGKFSYARLYISRR